MVYTQPHGQRVPTKSVPNSCVATTFDSLGWSENEFQTSSEAEPQVERSSATVTERWSIQPSVPFRGRNKWVMVGMSESRFERPYCDCAVQHEAERESSQNRKNPRQQRQEVGGKKA